MNKYNRFLIWVGNEQHWRDISGVQCSNDRLDRSGSNCIESIDSHSLTASILSGPQCQLTHPTQTPLTASRSIQGTFHDSSDYPKLSY